MSDVESYLLQVEKEWPRARLECQAWFPRIAIHPSWQDKQFGASRLRAGLDPKADEKLDSLPMLSYMQPPERTPGKDTAF